MCYFMGKTVAIILNGIALSEEIKEDIIICADGGSKLLIGRKPNIVVGDFDSSDIPEDIETKIYSSHKDMSDGVLAVDYAGSLSPSEVVIYAANGGRFDHIVANLSLLQYADKKGINARIRDKNCCIYFKTESFTLKTQKGKTVSLISTEGCKVTKSYGLEYPLDNLHLNFENASRGISNITVDNYFTVDIADGSLFVFLFD